MPFPWKRQDRSGLFYVECECGAEFQVGYDPEANPTRAEDPFLARLTGSCPSCGLKLEEIEPFGGAPLRRPR